jgi:tetratricopeptide (TPR) repeat protein
MWYLIIPPIVVIASLASLIWFLSDRAKQPLIQERMEDIARHSSFREWQTLRLKHFFFLFLEKNARLLKIFSLRIHNAFHSMGQSIRERRHRSDLLITSLLDRREEEKSAESGDAEDLSRREVPEDTALTTPAPSGESIQSPVSRPMVSAQAVVPETRLNTVIARDIKEEEKLIKKIAANPKSVSAYEALGDYYLERGDVNDAKSCYRQVLKLSPVHRMVKIKIRKLERIMEEQKGNHAE